MTNSNVSIVVTGGSGFVGATIVRFLHKAYPSWPITIFDIVAPDTDDVDPTSHADANIAFIHTDVRDRDAVRSALERTKPTLVVHSAGVVPKGQGRYDGRDREFVMLLNVEGTKHVVEESKRAGVTALVFTGSCTSITDDLDHEYPNFSESCPFPENALVYGKSKQLAEKIVLEANSSTFATCSLRPSTILGPKDYNLVPHIHACIANYETPFIIGPGDNLYDFTFVDNVAHAHLLAIENLLFHSMPSSKASRTRPYTSAAGHAILISNAQPITFRDFCLAVWAAFGHTPPFAVCIPTRLAGFAGYVAEWFSWVSGRPTTLSRGSVKDAVGTRYADITKAREVLRFEPVVDLWDGIRITAQAYTERLNKGLRCL